MKLILPCSDLKTLINLTDLCFIFFTVTRLYFCRWAAGKKKENVKVTKRKRTICPSFFVDFTVHLESGFKCHRVRVAWVSRRHFNQRRWKPGGRLTKCILWDGDTLRNTGNIRSVTASLQERAAWLAFIPRATAAPSFVSLCFNRKATG